MNEWKITIAHGCRYSLIFIEYKNLHCQINLQIVSPIRQFRFIIYDEGLNFIKKTTQVFFLRILRNFYEHLFRRTSANGCFCDGMITESFTILTHLLPMDPFSTPWKHQKTLGFFDVFRGVEKGCIMSEWIKLWLFTNGFMRWNCNYNYTMVCNTSW